MHVYILLRMYTGEFLIWRSSSPNPQKQTQSAIRSYISTSSVNSVCNIFKFSILGSSKIFHFKKEISPALKIKPKKFKLDDLRKIYN